MTTPAARAYTNARRAGRTKPDLVETISRTDHRHHLNAGVRVQPNRADLRAHRPPTTRMRPAIHPLRARIQAVLERRNVEEA